MYAGNPYDGYNQLDFLLQPWGMLVDYQAALGLLVLVALTPVYVLWQGAPLTMAERKMRRRQAWLDAHNHQLDERRSERDILNAIATEARINVDRDALEREVRRYD